VAWLLEVGGIELRRGVQLGRGVTLASLLEAFDAVFLGIGLGGVGALEAEGAARQGVRPAVDFIAELRQSDDLAALPVGRRVVVIGGGMTAIDAGVQAKKLGAEEVTIVYRRSRERMGASRHEQDLAARAGVRIVAGAVPVAVAGNGPVGVVEFAYTDGDTGARQPETFRLATDQLLTAIGQTLAGVPEGLEIAGGKIAVTGAGRTSLPRVWAGGDCTSGGADLTVTAVAEGRDAAMDIHAALTGRD
jgi:glutamate synthase (NADPH/NADH) small chain